MGADPMVRQMKYEGGANPREGIIENVFEVSFLGLRDVARHRESLGVLSGWTVTTSLANVTTSDGS